jgi:cell division protein FtsW (lipid II flippase)
VTAAVQPPRRRTELGLILLVGLVTAGAVTLASLGKVGEPPPGILGLAGVMVVLIVAAHLAVRRLAVSADPIILPLALLLNGLGYTMITRLDSDLAALQATWTAVGIAAFAGTLLLVRRGRDLERYRYTFLALGLVLLLLPLVPGLGRTINGARIWIRLGPIGFQPGELAKILLAIFFASYLVERRELLGDRIRVGPIHLPRPRLRVLLPLLAAWGVSIIVMVAERDLGSSLLFFGLFIGLLWLATGQPAYLLGGAALFALASSFAYQLFGHVQTRVEIWLDPWPSAQEQGYQIVQSMFAFGSGGVAGSGLALGSPQRIPAASTDFIFAAIGEELGLLGTTAVLVAFLLLIGSGLRIALRASHPFEKLLAAGLTLVLGLQTFIIVGGITRVVPLTGITLPFVSYGGSSLVANYILIALLLRISDQQPAGRPGLG